MGKLGRMGTAKGKVRPTCCLYYPTCPTYLEEEEKRKYRKGEIRKDGRQAGQVGQILRLRSFGLANLLPYLLPILRTCPEPVGLAYPPRRRPSSQAPCA